MKKYHIFISEVNKIDFDFMTAKKDRACNKKCIMAYCRHGLCTSEKQLELLTTKVHHSEEALFFGRICAIIQK